MENIYQSPEMQAAAIAAKSDAYIRTAVAYRIERREGPAGQGKSIIHVSERLFVSGDTGTETKTEVGGLITSTQNPQASARVLVLNGKKGEGNSGRIWLTTASASDAQAAMTIDFSLPEKEVPSAVDNSSDANLVLTIAKGLWLPTTDIDTKSRAEIGLLAGVGSTTVSTISTKEVPGEEALGANFQEIAKTVVKFTPLIADLGFKIVTELKNSKNNAATELDDFEGFSDVLGVLSTIGQIAAPIAATFIGTAAKSFLMGR